MRILKSTLLVAVAIALVTGATPASAGNKQGGKRANLRRAAHGRQANRTRFHGNPQRRFAAGKQQVKRMAAGQRKRQLPQARLHENQRKRSPLKPLVKPGNKLHTLPGKLHHRGKQTGAHKLPFVPKHLGRKLHQARFHELLKHRSVLRQTAGYRHTLSYAHRHHWHRRPRCGWWSDLAINCYFVKHRAYCPHHYWSQCHRLRYVYVACPATPVHQTSYWYFGCEVVYIPEVGYGIESITPHSPAALAGLQQGDMIVQIAGQAPADDGALANAIQATGGQLGLSVLKEGSVDPQSLQIALQRVQQPGL